ncbi:MAG: hypothetical protein ABL994_13990, partial [Verrucomicrobiales bacterium]
MAMGWSAASICIVLILFHSNSARWVEERELRNSLFWAREFLGKEPQLSDKLAIFVLGDTSAAAIEGIDLPLQEWAYLFRSLERQGVRDVLIDKIFSFESPQASTAFVREMKKMKRPPVTGAFVSPQEIPGRFSIPSDHPSISFRSPLVTESTVTTAPIYGPSRAVLDVLHRPGLINSETGTVPLFVMKGSASGIPFAPALLAESLAIGADGLHLNGIRVPEISPGRVFVNFLSPKTLKNRKHTLQSLREDLTKKAGSASVRPGSTVLILTAYYTGG